MFSFGKQNQSSILSISLTVTVALILTNQLVITQVHSAISSFRVYRNAPPPSDLIISPFPLPPELESDPNPSESKSESFSDPWLPDSTEINSNVNGTVNGTGQVILRRRRIKGRRRTTTNMDSTELTTAIVTTIEPDTFTTETTEPTNTISGAIENTQESVTVVPQIQEQQKPLEDLLQSNAPDSKEHKSDRDKVDTFSATFEDLFAPLSINHETVSSRRKNATVSNERNLDHLTQFTDNAKETDLHISESSNPYLNSSTPISTELQKSLQFEYLHPILNSDNVITDAEQKIPENKTTRIQNTLSSSLVNTPIAHDVRHSPGHLRKKHPLLNHDSIISSDFAKNGPRLDVPPPLVPKNINSNKHNQHIKSGYILPEHTSKPSFPTSTVHDDDYGQNAFTVILPKDFEMMEITEKTNSIDPIKHFGGIESTTRFNTYTRQTEPQKVAPPPSQVQSTSQEQINEYELLQQLLGIEKSLSQISIPSQSKEQNSNSVPPQLSNQSNEEDLKTLLQLPEFSFLDSILNPTSSTSSTTKATTTTTRTTTAVPSKNTGLSDSDLRSIYYMLERMVIHSNSASTAKPDLTTSAKPSTTTTKTTTAFPSLDSIFNIFSTAGQTTQEKRNVAPGPVYKHANSNPGPRNLDGSPNAGATQNPGAAAPNLNQPKPADNSLDLLSQLLQLSIAAESANANKPARSTPAPQAHQAIPLDLLTLLANSNLGQGSPLAPAPATKAPEISPSETMQLLNIFANQNTQKPNGLYYWLDLNAFLGGDPTADPTSGIRPKLGHREHFVKV